mgnify:FL=1
MVGVLILSAVTDANPGFGCRSIMFARRRFGAASAPTTVLRTCRVISRILGRVDPRLYYGTLPGWTRPLGVSRNEVVEEPSAARHAIQARVWLSAARWGNQETSGAPSLVEV